jgi:hypothetical protein
VTTSFGIARLLLMLQPLPCLQLIGVTMSFGIARLLVMLQPLPCLQLVGVTTTRLPLLARPQQQMGTAALQRVHQAWTARLRMVLTARHT